MHRKKNSKNEKLSLVTTENDAIECENDANNNEESEEEEKRDDSESDNIEDSSV